MRRFLTLSTKGIIVAVIGEVSSCNNGFLVIAMSVRWWDIRRGKLLWKVNSQMIIIILLLSMLLLVVGVQYSDRAKIDFSNRMFSIAN